MKFRDQITLALMSYGIGEIAFYEIEGTNMTAIRVTDQPYDPDLARMIADDILAPMYVQCAMVASNCRYDTDDKLGAVFVTRDIEPEWSRVYREARAWEDFDTCLVEAA